MCFAKNFSYLHLPDITPLPTLIIAPWKLQPRSVSLLYTLNKKDVSQPETQQPFHLFREEHPDFQFIFTDGSKENERTGNGLVVEGIGHIKGRLPDDISIYIAELHAILIALRLSSSQFQKDVHLFGLKICFAKYP